MQNAAIMPRQVARKLPTGYEQNQELCTGMRAGSSGKLTADANTLANTGVGQPHLRMNEVTVGGTKA